MVVTREMWAHSLLKWMGLPDSERNIVALIAWQAAEGGPPNDQAKWNPLNTTQPMPGADDFNWVHVKNYPSETAGLDATAKTFKTPNQGYEKIVKRLGRSARPRRTLKAVERSAWGTSGLAKSIVDDVRNHFDQYAKVLIGQ
jgi:hypothetical protein